MVFMIISAIGQFFLRGWIKKILLKLAIGGKDAVIVSRATSGLISKLFNYLKHLIENKKLKAWCVRKSLGTCAVPDEDCEVMKSIGWKPEDFPKCQHLKALDKQG